MDRQALRVSSMKTTPPQTDPSNAAGDSPQKSDGPRPASASERSGAAYDANTLRHIIEYCQAQWEKADGAPPSEWPTLDMQIGRKMAFNNVLQYARTLLAEPN